MQGENMERFEINTMRIFRDICDGKKLSLGAIGVLAYMLFNSSEYEGFNIDEVEAHSNNTREECMRFIEELKLHEYIIEEK